MRIYPVLQAFVLTVLVAMPSTGAMADAGLDDWRAQIGRVRMLAENDIPAAYRDALLLQSSQPASANAADKTRLLNLLARIEVYLGDTAEAERYAKEAFELALKNGDRAGQAEADLSNALNTVNQARFDAMSEAIKHSMDILEGVDRPDLLAEAMLRTSMMFRRFDRFDDSIEVAMQAMDIAKRSNDPLALVYAYQGMAIAYDFSGRKAEARDYYAKMRRAAQDNHSRLQEGDALIGLGAAMTSMGDVKSAERLIRDGNLLYRKAGGPFYLAHGLHMLADNLRHQGRLAEAQTVIDETVAIYEKKSNRVGLWWALNQRSVNSRALGRPIQAKVDANRAYKLAREIGHFLYLSESVRMQAVIAAEAGDFKSAYRLAAEATELAAKSARERASEHVLELTRRYENDSRQRQLDELTRSNEMQSLHKRWLWTLLGGSTVLLVIAVLFLLQLRRSREEVRKLNIDLEQRVHERTAELHQSRQSLAEAQRIAHVGSWELDLAANKLKWSDEVFRIFEIEPQAFGATYEDFLAAVHPEDRNRVAEAYSRSLRKHEPYEIEHRLAFPDGRIKYVHERSETVFAADGKPLHSIGTVQDITERKLAEMVLHENLEQITLLNRHLEDSARTMEEQATELEASQEQLEDALEFSEGVINAIPDMLFEVDRNGRYLNVWTRTPELLAAQKEMLLGRTVHEVLSPENAAAAMEAIREADEEGASFIKDLCIELPDGKHWFAHSLARKPGTHNSETTFIVLSRDITERKLVEEALAAREREFRALAESSPGMMGSFYLRPDGTVCMPYVSPKIFNLFGLQPQDVFEDASSLMRLNHPDDVQRVMDSIAESARTMMPWHCEFRIQHPTKGERWMESNTNPQPHPDGGTIWYGYVHDITDRKRAEHAHEETRARLQSVLQTIPDLVWMKDVDGIYLSCNHEFERFFGAKEAEIIGKTDHDFVDAELADFFRQKDREAIAAERICINEEWVTFADDGRRVLLEARKVPVYDEDGKVIGVLGVSRDITERKHMEAALKESEARYRYNSNLLQAIIESPSSSVSIYALDREYRFLAFNSRFQKAAKRLWHADIELGMSMLDAIDNEAHREFSRQGFDHVLAGNHGFLESREERIEDGKPVCEYHDNYGSPIYNDNGEVIGMTVFVLNTTERKEAEQKLKEALEFSEGIINAIPDLLFEVDAQGRYLNVWTHTPELLAAQKEALLGKTVRDVLSPESAAIILEALREAGEHDVSFGKVIRIDLPQGERWFELSVSKKPGGSPAANTFLVLSRDITGRKRMEAVIAAREAEFRFLAESSPDNIIRVDREQRVRYLNSSLVRSMGLSSAEELVGKRRDEVWPDGRFSSIEQAEWIAMESGKTQVIDFSLPGRNGQAQLIIVPERDAEGRIVGTTAFGRDVTSIREAERRLAHFFNNLPGLAYTFRQWPDGTMRFTSVSSAVAEIYGVSEEEALGDFAVVHADVPEEDRLRIEAAIVKSARDMSPQYVEFRICKPGKPMRWMDARSIPERQPDGGIQWYGIMLDITARKQLEAELLASRNFLDSVIDSVSDPIFVKDRQHRWTFLNDAFCTFIDRPRDALVGKSDYDFFPKEQADVFWAKDELVFESGEVNLNEERFTSANGEEHHIQTKKTPFVSGDGRQMLVGVIRDITELKHYEAAREAALAEAQRLAKLRSEFIAHMSHELRTPLNGILGYAQMLGRDDKLNEKQRVSVEVIRHSGEHLLALIEDILDLARIESGRLKLDIGDIPLIRFLHVVSGIIGVRAKQKNLDFVFELAPDLPQGIRGDEKRLRQVLLNLLSNAVKFTDQGRVTLSVRRVSPSRLAFAVSDTGIGIELSDREKIFQSFEQVGDAQRRTGGTGLGLSISRQLVRMMGGDIELESHPGDGSTFRFELELPEVGMELAAMRAVSADEPTAEPVGTELPAEPLVAPPQEEMRELRRLALLGNMRDIARYAGHIADLDPRYRSFAEHLTRLAEGFQSKAILVFVEGYMK